MQILCGPADDPLYWPPGPFVKQSTRVDEYIAGGRAGIVSLYATGLSASCLGHIICYPAETSGITYAALIPTVSTSLKV